MTKDIAVSMVPLTVMVGYEIANRFYVGAGLGINRVTQKITDNYEDPTPLRYVSGDDIPPGEAVGNFILDPITNENTYNLVSSEEEFKGSGTRAILCAGYEIPLGPLAIGVQAQYILGKYIQEVSEDYYKFSVERDNGTDGISFLVNIGYSFGE